MSTTHIRRLKKRHAAITRIIAKKQSIKGYDPLVLGELKKTRLSIKDRIARIEAAERHH